DVAVTAQVALADVATGASVDIAFDAVDACERCHGNGAEPGTPIETCPRCEGAGELRSVSRTPFGQMVRAVVCDACAGEGKIAREPCTECRGRGRTARRKRLKVDVPAGIEDGQRIRLSGRGHAGEGGGPAGDLRVVVNVVVPRNLSEEQRDLLGRLKDTLTEENLRSDEGVFAKLRRVLRA